MPPPVSPGANDTDIDWNDPGAKLAKGLTHINYEVPVNVPPGLSLKAQVFDVSPMSTNSLAYWAGLQGKDIHGNKINPPPFNGFPDR